MLRHFHPKYTAELLQLITEAIRAIDDVLYSPEQKQVWLSGISEKNHLQWEQRFTQQITLVYCQHNQPIGLLSGTEDYIDLLFVSPKRQGLGYGKMLLQNFFKSSKAPIIRANASLAALPFFLAQKFVSNDLSFTQRGQVTLPFHPVWIKTTHPPLITTAINFDSGRG